MLRLRLTMLDDVIRVEGAVGDSFQAASLALAETALSECVTVKFAAKIAPVVLGQHFDGGIGARHGRCHQHHCGASHADARTAKRGVRGSG